MTMLKRVCALVFLCTLIAIPAQMFLSGWPHNFPELTVDYVTSGEFTAAAERSMKANFPLREEFSNLAWNLRYQTGAKELDGYFITERGSIIKNVTAPNRDLVALNNDIIQTFTEQTWLPFAYFTILPTACAIKQEDLPAFATVYNQKNFIENTYKKLSPGVITINTYAALLEQRSNAIYYNSEDLLTPLGGYAVYKALGAKLDFTPRPMDQFLVEYVSHSYLGSLAQRYPYAATRPDVIALYHFDDGFGSTGEAVTGIDYTVTCVTETEKKTHTSLYRRETLATVQPLNIYPGSAPIVHIAAANRPNTSLIVFGDATSKSYLPFLALHYSNLTFVDVRTVTEDLIHTLDLSRYDRALFAFSADTYLHDDAIQTLEYIW